MLHAPLMLHEHDDDDWFVLESLDALESDTHDILWGLAYAGYDVQGVAFDAQPCPQRRAWLGGLVTTTHQRWCIAPSAAPPDVAGATLIARRMVQDAIATMARGRAHPPTPAWIGAASLPTLLQWMLTVPGHTNEETHDPNP